MQLDVPRFIEQAAGDVARAGRTAAGSLGTLVHDARLLRSRPRRRPGRTAVVASLIGLITFALVLARVVAAINERRAQRETGQGGAVETTVPAPPVPEAARTTDRVGTAFAAEGLA